MLNKTRELVLITISSDSILRQLGNSKDIPIPTIEKTLYKNKVLYFSVVRKENRLFCVIVHGTKASQEYTKNNVKKVNVYSIPGEDQDIIKKIITRGRPELEELSFNFW